MFITDLTAPAAVLTATADCLAAKSAAAARAKDAADRVNIARAELFGVLDTANADRALFGEVSPETQARINVAAARVVKAQDAVTKAETRVDSTRRVEKRFRALSSYGA